MINREIPALSEYVIEHAVPVADCEFVALWANSNGVWAGNYAIENEEILEWDTNTNAYGHINYVPAFKDDPRNQHDIKVLFFLVKYELPF